jgi:hypothetical protein
LIVSQIGADQVEGNDDIFLLVSPQNITGIASIFQFYQIMNMGFPPPLFASPTSFLF